LNRLLLETHLQNQESAVEAKATFCEQSEAQCRANAADMDFLDLAKIIVKAKKKENLEAST